MSVKDYRTAINEAIDAEMSRDKTVFLIGEDIAGGRGTGGEQDAWGGTFAVTKGLIGKHGEKRVLDAPLSEMAFVGASVGAAAAGMRPIVELMFVDFVGVAYDAMLNQAAKMRYMFGGKAKVPMVVRAHYGAGFRSCAQHAQSLYPVFTHIPGLKVVIPSSPYDAKGLMISSIRDDDPVIFLENKVLYDAVGEVPDESYSIPLGQANVLSEGDDVTIVATGRMVQFAQEAIKELQGDGVSVTLVDPRCASPIDMETIVETAEETGRLVIVDESSPRCGLAVDIAGHASKALWGKLKSPIELVTPPHTPIPFAPNLEDLYIPSAERIVAAARQTLS